MQILMIEIECIATIQNLRDIRKSNSKIRNQIAFAQTSGPNSNSRLICEPCISRLRDAAEFKKQVLECEKTFMQHLAPGSSSFIAEAGESSEKEVKLEGVKEEKEESDDDFNDRNDFGDDDDDLDDEPLTKLATKVPKKESVDLLDLIETKKVAEKRKTATKVKTPPAKKTKTKEVVKPSQSKTVAKTVDKKKKGKHPLNASMQHSIKILKYSTAYPFKLTGRNLIKCCFCTDSFEEPTDFRQHVDTEHTTVDRSVALIGKNIIRIDITDLRCKMCIKAFGTIELLCGHLNEEHDQQINKEVSLCFVPIKLQKGKYICLFCKKKFTGFRELSRHSGSHFLRVICHVCGKNFETEKGLEEHRRSKHSGTKYYCKSCKCYFPNKEAKKAHVRMNQACLPFCCRVCKERFLFWELRENHLVTVHGQPKKLFPCTECERVFEKRTRYYLHFKSAHTEELQCEYCKLTFGTRRDLKEHLSSHTGKRNYKCTICDKSFVREKNFRQHEIIHDDSKKQACGVCNRLFVGKSKLKIHVKKHHPDSFVQSC